MSELADMVVYLIDFNKNIFISGSYLNIIVQFNNFINIFKVKSNILIGKIITNKEGEDYYLIIVTLKKKGNV